jgi:small nuclear ribonucleoprotein
MLKTCICSFKNFSQVKTQTFLKPPVSILCIMELDRPLDALNNSRGKNILVELKNGKQFVGKLKSFDIHINIVLENAEERVDGEVKRKVGTAFLRGDTIVLISA